MSLPTNQLDSPLSRRVAEAWPVDEWRDVHVLVAVSGGADSMALLRVLVELKRNAAGAGRLYVGHVNHQLRGQDSDADEAFVAAACRRLGVELLVRRHDASAAAAEQGDGLEAAARAGRYRLLAESAETIGARFVAVGHTRDDQIETVLFRILRGTGLRGAAGMPATRPLTPAVGLVRPLLAPRLEVRRYLESIDQPWREDATNADPRFARNWIRNELLPLLVERTGADVTEAIGRLAEQAVEVQQALDKLAGDLLKRCNVQIAAGNARGAVVTLDATPLRQQPEALVCEALRMAWRRAALPQQAMTRDHWRRLAAAAVADAEPIEFDLPGVHAARRSGQLVLIV